MKCSSLAVLCAALVVSTVSTAHSALQVDLIDDFTSSPQTINFSGGSGSLSNTNAMFDPDILGGRRTLSLNVTPGRYDLNAVFSGGQSGLVLDTRAIVPATGGGATGRGWIDAAVTWDVNGAGLAGFDLTSSGRMNSFLFLVEGMNANVVLGLEVTDTNGNSAQYSRSGSTAGYVAYSFAKYSGVNLASADSVRLSLAGSFGSDASIQLFGTYSNAPQTTLATPEPSSFAAFGLFGLCGVFGAWLRRRRS